MADALIETITSNPYESIVADTATQIARIDTQIQEVVNNINNLEKTNPTSPTLTQLRERLTQLQNRRSSLNSQNNSANDLMQAYNKSVANVSTLAWIYQLKDADIWKVRNESDREYKSMEDETRRNSQNYINALWNANSSENAIINANAARDWASAQSTAEMRARNYLNNAQAQYEAANQAQQNINAIKEWKINTNAWYLQLAQSNADNTLRQQAIYDLEAAEAERQRQASYWWGSGSYSWWSRSSWRWTSNIVDPYKEFSWNWWWWNWWWWWWTKVNWEDQWIIDQTMDVRWKIDAWVYWNVIWDVWLYHNKTNWKVTTNNWNYSWANQIRSAMNREQSPNTIADLDRKKTNNFLQKDNSKRDLNSTFAQITDKWYVVFTDWNWNTKVWKLSDLKWQNESKPQKTKWNNR